MPAHRVLMHTGGFRPASARPWSIELIISTDNKYWSALYGLRQNGLFKSRDLTRLVMHQNTVCKSSQRICLNISGSFWCSAGEMRTTQSSLEAVVAPTSSTCCPMKLCWDLCPASSSSSSSSSSPSPLSRHVGVTVVMSTENDEVAVWSGSPG